MAANDLNTAFAEDAQLQADLLNFPDQTPSTEEHDQDDEDEQQQQQQLTAIKPFSLIAFFGSLSINLFLPFINGLMLGFGELVAHEIGFKYNWLGANIYRPVRVRQPEQRTRLI